jgi:hypothetical protein
VFALVHYEGRFALVWGDVDDRIMLSILLPTGARAVPDVVLAETGAQQATTLGAPRLVWTGAELAILLRTANGLAFQRRNDKGEPLAPATTSVTDPVAGARVNPSLATANGYGAVWSDGRGTGAGPGLYFATLDPAGQKVGNDVRVNAVGRTTLRTGIAFSSGFFGVAWETNDSVPGQEEVIFVRMSPAAIVTPPELHIVGRRPYVVARGTELALVTSRLGADVGEIYLTRIDAATGQRIGNDLRVTNTATSSNTIGLWSTGRGYGISWLESTNPNEAWFREVCPE